MTCRLPADQNEIDAVEGRLSAYNLYEKGPVCWTHPCISWIVVCPQPEDLDNPNTFQLPTTCRRKQTKVVHNDFIEEADRWSWGALHSEVEGLFLDGWLAEGQCQEGQSDEL